MADLSLFKKKEKKPLLKKVVKFIAPTIAPRATGVVNVVSKILKSKPVQESLAKEAAISRLPIGQQAKIKAKQTGNTIRDIVGGIVGGTRYVGQTIIQGVAGEKARQSLDVAPEIRQKIFGKLAPRNESAQEFIKKDVIPFSEKHNLPKGLTVPLAFTGSIFLEGPGAGFAKGVLKPTAKEAFKLIGKEFIEGGEEAAAKKLKELIPVEQHGLVDEAISRMKGLKENNALDEDFLPKYVEENVPPLKKTEEIRKELPVEEALLRETSPTSELRTVDQKSIPSPENISDNIIPVKDTSFEEARLVQALRDAKPIREKQETLYSKERSRRLGQALNVGKKVKGEKGYFMQLSKLKGELPKAEYESIRQSFTQETIDNFFDRVRNELPAFEQITAEGALLKILGEGGVTVPTRSEIKLLEKVFSKELVDELIDKMPLVRNFGDGILNLINLPKTWAAGFFDFSGSLRQGIIALPRYPKEYWKAFKNQFKAFGSERAFKAINDEIANNKWYTQAKEADLQLTEVGSDLTRREEQYMSSWGEHMPAEFIEKKAGKAAATPFKAYNKTVGRAVRATSRAYSAFLNMLRMGMFSKNMNNFEKLGYNVKENFDLQKDTAKIVNSITGRGDWGKAEIIMPYLNAIFFSPKWIKSRLDLLGMAANPANYFSSNPAKKEALKTIYTFLGTLGGALVLIDQIPGVEIGKDSNSADFGKIVINKKHRLDLSGGLQQYVRMVSQLISGKYVSSVTGKEITLGEGFKPLTKGQILGRQIQSKEAPLLAFITKIMQQQDFKGDPIDIPKEFLNMITPMTPRDAVELIKEDPSMTPLILGSIFGASLQTYSDSPSKTKLDLSSFKPKPLSSGKIDLSAFKKK